MQETALSKPATAKALARHRARTYRLARLSAAVLACGVMVSVLGARRNQHWVPAASALLVLLPSLSLLLSLRLRWVGDRMRPWLTALPWIACEVCVAANGRNWIVVLQDPETGELWPLTVRTLQQWHSLANPGPGGTVLWWCGDPATGGVLSTPGGEHLIWARAPRLGRPASVPQAATRRVPERMSPAQPRRHPGPQVSLVKAGTSPSFGDRTRHRGFFRWVAAVGMIGVALSIGVEIAGRHDPQIDLTVLSEKPDGSCLVSWTDPWDHTERQGPFHCDPDRDPLLTDWETGFVVSFGPWKGDLYDSRLRGTPTFDVGVAVCLTGLALTAVGIPGGIIRRRVRGSRTRHAALLTQAAARHRAWQPSAPGSGTWVPSEADRRPFAHTLAPPPGTLFTFAALAAEAQRRHPRLRPAVFRWQSDRDRDIREVSWWRVRSLRRTTSLYALVLFPLYGSVSLLTEDHSRLALSAAGLAITLFWLYRFVRSELPTVRALVRAARAPVPVPKRYVLLRDPDSGDPLLLFFPAHGGPEDLPEAVLQLMPPGPRDKTWVGLPIAPSGHCELHGWLSDPPAVVPWIEGRPLWPRLPYQEINPRHHDVRRRLSRLAPGAAGAPVPKEG